MSNKIKLNSRGDNNYLVNMLNRDGTESKAYRLELENSYVRVGYTGNNRRFIDPSGGPMISVGEVLPEIGKEVESITYNSGYGYVITFKE